MDMMEHRQCGWDGCIELISRINPKTNRFFYYCDTHMKLRKKHKDAHYAKTRDAHNLDTLKRYHELRRQVLVMYGGHCNCCGESEFKFLALDHIQGGGQKHRKARGGNYGVYKDAIEHYDPNRFQVLCHNCNMARYLYGECPHKLVNSESKIW